MLDGVDRPRQLLDRAREGDHEFVDERARRPDPPGRGGVLLDRVGRHDVAQQPDETHRGGRLEMAVVDVIAQPVEEAMGVGRDLRPQHGQHDVTVRGVGDGPLDRLARLAQRARRAVDGERRLVPEQVPDHRRQHEAERRVDRRHGDRRRRAVALLALVGDHDRRRLVGAEDRGLLRHVVGGAAAQTGGADEDQRLGRQVDVLLVLGGVGGDRLVAELAELDPDLLGGDPVGTVADHRPVALRRRQPAGGVGDLVALGVHAFHRLGQLTQAGQQLGPTAV